MLYFFAANARSSGVLGYGPGSMSLERPEAVKQNQNANEKDLVNISLNSF